MARIRQIKPEFYLDDELALCSRDARFLFIGLWILADRAGRLEERHPRIKAQIFPYDVDIGSADIDNFLEQLQAYGFIIRYQAAGKHLIQIRTFERHQHCHVKEPDSQLPPPQSPVQEPGKTGASTVPAPGEYGASTGLAPGEHRASTSEEISPDSGKTPPTPAFTSTSALGEVVGVGSSSGEGGPGEGAKPKASKSIHTHTPTLPELLTEKLLEECEEIAPGIDPISEAEKFLDHYRRDGTTFADWPAAFRKWMRDAVKLEERARSPSRRESRAERNERIIREVEAEDRAKAASAEHGGRSP